MTECCGTCARVLSELKAIRRLLVERGSALSRSDREALARLLPAIGGVLGADLFLASEVAQHRSPALRVARGTLTARQIGRLLRRGEGTPIDGYIVRSEGTEAGAVLWSVQKVPEFPED